MSHVTNETLRKSVHIGFGLFAFTFKWLPLSVAVAACIVAIIGNWLVLHRIVGSRIARHERGYDAGIVLYPTAVLLLILVFRERIEYAAIAFALLAFGDGVATITGKAMPLAPLPWNRSKSWGGLLGFLIAGSAGALAVAYWMNFREPMVVLLAALAAGITETLDLHVDDNLTVPFAASVALLIGGLHPTLPYSAWPAMPAWLVVNAVLALVGYYARSVSFSGALGGWLLGTILIVGAGPPLYVALLAFFIIGTAATKLGYARKAKLGLAQEGGGRRGFSHAFSNVGVAAICAIAISRASRIDDHPLELMTIIYLMAIASLATAAADTTASEIGQLVGRRAFLPLTLRRVPVGTEGAISVEGTLAGIMAGFIVALAAVLSLHYGLGVDPGPAAIPLLTASAFAGSYLESLVGSWNRKRIDPVPNGVLNFFNTTAGALLMYIAWQIAT